MSVFICVYLYTTVNRVKKCMFLYIQTLLQGHCSFKKTLNECARHPVSFQKGEITAHSSSDTSLQACNLSVEIQNLKYTLYSLFVNAFRKCFSITIATPSIIECRQTEREEIGNVKGISAQIMISQGMLTDLRTAQHISDDLAVPKVSKSA